MRRRIRSEKGESVQRRVWLIIAVLSVVGALAGCSFFGDSAAELTNWEPELSPDGTTLVYESASDGSLQLYARDLATDEERRLTRDEFEDWSPDWSPNGEQIAFASLRDKNNDIYILSLETGETRRLTTHESDDINPDWAIDGRIYFNSNRSGVWEIYAIDPDGSNLVQITRTQPAE